MAGILCNSASVTHSSSTPDDTNTGYLGQEQCTLSTSPSQASYSWSLAGPSGSVATLDTTTGATPKFTPDKSGFFTIVEAESSYTLRITVALLAHVPTISAVRLVPLTDAQVPTPAEGRTLYYSSTQSSLATKDSAGAIRTVDETSV